MVGFTSWVSRSVPNPAKPLPIAGFILLHVAAWALLHGPYPWVALPLAFGLILPAVTALGPELRASRLFLPYFTLLSVLFVGLWLRSNFPGEQLNWTGLALALGAAGLIALSRSFPEQRRLLAWMAPPFFMALGVAYLSGAKGGSDHMAPLFKGFGFNSAQLEEIVHVIRKCFHFGFYGTFGYFWLRVFGVARERVDLAGIHALAMTFCLAGFDELRQSTAPNRTAQFSDVLLDLSGAATFVVLALAIRRLRKPRERAISA